MERWGRFRHQLKQTTDHAVGPFKIEYWPPGHVMLLPESCKSEAEGKGYEFLNWAPA